MEMKIGNTIKRLEKKRRKQAIKLFFIKELRFILVAPVILLGGAIMIYIFLGANTSDGYLGIVQFYIGAKPDGGFLLFVDNFFKAIVTMSRGAM